MAISNIIDRQVDLTKAIKLEHLGRLFAELDNEAHTFRIAVVSGGSPVNLAGCSAQGYFIAANNETMVIPGSVSSNVVTLILPKRCYQIVGRFQLVIRLADGEKKTSVYWATADISRTATDTVVDPADVVPDITDLLNIITEIETKGAETIASIPQDYTALTTEVSDLKSAFALFQENIPGTVQTIAFDSAGNVQSITHMEGTTAVRTDVFTFGTSTITEVRTLATGESLTIVTNTTTLMTTVTYAA
jgi:hypothetical protein